MDSLLCGRCEPFPARKTALMRGEAAFCGKHLDSIEGREEAANRVPHTKEEKAVCTVTKPGEVEGAATMEGGKRNKWQV